MTLTSRKVLHHIKKILPLPNLKDINWNSEKGRNDFVISISAKLCSLHKEYQLEPMGELHSLVMECISTYIKEEDAEYEKRMIDIKESFSRPELSLNSQLQSQYIQSSNSKRQRPNDPKIITFEDSQNCGIPTPEIFDLQKSGELSPLARTGIKNSVIDDQKVSKTVATNSSTKKIKRRDDIKGSGQVKYSKSNISTADGKGTDTTTESSKTERTQVFLSRRPKNRLSQLAGLESILENIRELVFYPIQYPQLYVHLGVIPPCGILLHGPSGCGKTSLALAIAGELDLPFYKASGPELIGGTSGESEERIRDIFEAAIAAAPSVLFIDALDVIAAKKDSSNRAMDRRVVAQLFDSIDLLNTAISEDHDNAGAHSGNLDPPAGAIATPETEQQHPPPPTKRRDARVILIAATNKPDALDPGVRGRFSKEIGLPVPDAPSRTKILQLMTVATRLDNDVDLTALGKLTPGFVGADLQALVREAGMIAVTRIVKAGNEFLHGATASLSPCPIPGENDLEKVLYDSNASVVMEDLLKAAKSIQPTAKREGFAVAPNVTWADVGALVEVREELLHNVLDPIANPERFRRLGLEVPAGVLFFGPPGCGKTLLAKALANQSGANFISVKGPELLNLYVGESESRVRQVFSRARASAPCVIFFDELDALCPKRGGGWGADAGSGGNGVTERVVNQLLTELDGLEVRKDVYVIAATNRLELIDEAMLRPGRLGKLLYVPLPSADDRVSILSAIAKKVHLANDVELQSIGIDPRCNGFSGADLAALLREAGIAEPMAVVNYIDSKSTGEDATLISHRHFEAAFGRVKPSVSDRDRQRYDRIQQFIKEGIGAIQALAKANSLSSENKLK